MGEGRDDFLDVMCDEKQCGCVFFGNEAAEEIEEFFPRDGVEACARFVEDEHGGFGHERPSDEYALAFALAEYAPFALGEVGAFGALHHLGGGVFVGFADGAPVVEHGVFSADDDEFGGIPVGHFLANGAADDSHALSEFSPIRFAECLAEERDRSARRGEVAGEGGK